MKYIALDTEDVRRLQAGEPDAYGRAPERTVSNGQGNPCRHCLRQIPQGAAMLILAHRPFPAMQPYAETGPIFLCADPCESGGDGDAVPGILATSPDYLVKGYGTEDRIVYGTGGVVPQSELVSRVERLFDDPRVAYLHVRSARNNCYLLRIDP